MDKFNQGLWPSEIPFSLLWLVSVATLLGGEVKPLHAPCGYYQEYPGIDLLG